MSAYATVAVGKTLGVLQVQGLAKSYVSQVLFDDVNFVVGKGERVGIVGRNGSGKTTLFRLILGEEIPDGGTMTTPNGYTFGYVSQKIAFSAPTVRDEACTALDAGEGWVEAYKAESILDGLGFARESLDAAPDLLSGGFQVRLNLAKVLLSEPSMLLLDEPTNYLDITSVRWLERFLRDWRGEMMLITHDRTFMDSVCTHTLAIHRKRVRKTAGGTAKLYEQIAHDEEVHAKTLANDAKKREEVERFVNKFRYKATKARQVQSRLKALERKGSLDELAEIANLDFAFSSAPFPGKDMLDAEHLSFGYGDEPLFSDLSFSIAPKERLAVVGPNGRGKTTLLNLLAGEMRPGAGEIRRSKNLRMGYFGQTNVDRLDPAKSVEDEIAESLGNPAPGAARTLAGSMMFPGDEALKKCSVLSGGERSRVLLAKILAQPANLLLLDEPSNHLDLESVETLMDAVDVFDGAVVIVTHNEALLHQVAERLVVFDGGEVTVFEGTYAEFLEKRGWRSESDPISSGGDPGAAAQPASEAKSPSKPESKKDARRQRALERESKQRLLEPIRREMRSTERRIERLEERCGELESQIVAASSGGAADGPEFADLAWDLRDAQDTRDQAYEYLTKLEADLGDGKDKLDG